MSADEQRPRADRNCTIAASYRQPWLLHPSPKSVDRGGWVRNSRGHLDSSGSPIRFQCRLTDSERGSTPNPQPIQRSSSSFLPWCQFIFRSHATTKTDGGPLSVRKLEQFPEPTFTPLVAFRHNANARTTPL